MIWSLASNVTSNSLQVSCNWVARSNVALNSHMQSSSCTAISSDNLVVFGTLLLFLVSKMSVFYATTRRNDLTQTCTIKTVTGTKRGTLNTIIRVSYVCRNLYGKDKSLFSPSPPLKKGISEAVTINRFRSSSQLEC